MQFGHYVTFADHETGGKSRAANKEQFIADYMAAMTRWMDRDRGVRDYFKAHVDHFYIPFEMESTWHDSGRPYFKVYPGLRQHLANTSLRFDAAYIMPPFKVFSVMLDGASFLARIWRKDREREYQKMSTSTNRKVEESGPPNCDLQVEVLASYAGDFGHISYFHLNDGQIVANELERQMGQFDGPPNLLKDFDATARTAQSREWITLAIAVAMFATNRHELVAPDIDREILVRKFPGGRSKASQKLAEEKIQREIAQVKGWKVGSEIDLPRPRVITQGHAPERGGELTCGHVRSGHMKMQPCGPRNQDRKLIFVAPTVVRPDLPIRAMHGYRIRTKGEKV